MMISHAHDYPSWRKSARELLQGNIHPGLVMWNEINNQTSLFKQQINLNPSNAKNVVPASFLKLAEIVCLNCNEERFNLLYHMLWRLIHENKHLIEIASDPLTNALQLMVKAVKRDVHKTHAFVRFRKIFDVDGEEHFIAWHKPDHYSLRLSAPFFQRRFGIMRWTILTPDESAHWDLEHLHYGPGAKSIDAPSDDIIEDLWKEFYRAIFNPARIKIKAMKREMPVRHWATMPETAIIKEMLQEAPRRVEKMIKHQEGHAYSVSDFLPKSLDLDELKKASEVCKGCPLYQNTTQTVFGVGPKNAQVMLVGEQPGDAEDKAGRPFIGPAGEVLNKALIEAGLDRSKLYITNAVKHFKHEAKPNIRLHRTPNLNDIVNCKPWLEAELFAVKPKIVICLGVTAARSLIDPRYKQQNRGESVSKDNIIYLPTYHPAAVLRNSQSDEIYNWLVYDLKKAANYRS